MNLAEQISKIEEASQRLNILADDVNPVIKEIDTFLKKSNVGVEVWLDRPLFTDVTKKLYLGFGRCTSNEVCIAIAWEYECVDDQQDNYVQSLSQSPRDVRLMSVKRLSELLEMILTALQSEVARTTSANEDVAELVSAIRLRKKGRNQ